MAAFKSALNLVLERLITHNKDTINVTRRILQEFLLSEYVIPVTTLLKNIYKNKSFPVILLFFLLIFLFYINTIFKKNLSVPAKFCSMFLFLSFLRRRVKAECGSLFLFIDRQERKPVRVLYGVSCKTGNTRNKEWLRTVISHQPTRTYCNYGLGKNGIPRMERE